MFINVWRFLQENQGFPQVLSLPSLKRRFYHLSMVMTPTILCGLWGSTAINDEANQQRRHKKIRHLPWVCIILWGIPGIPRTGHLGGAEEPMFRQIYMDSPTSTRVLLKKYFHLKILYLKYLELWKWRGNSQIHCQKQTFVFGCLGFVNVFEVLI